MNGSQGVAPPASEKLLATARVKIRLGLLSALILAGGWLLTPKAASPSLSVPEERAVPLLEEQVQPRAAASPFQGVTDTARELWPQTVAFLPRPASAPRVWDDFSAQGRRATPAGFGVFVSERYVLTHADALHGRLAIRAIVAGGSETDANVAAFDPASGLTLLRTSTPSPRVATLAASLASPGTLGVAVGVLGNYQVAVPVPLSTAEPGVYTLESDARLPSGTPIFDAEGRLLAVSRGDGPGGQAHAIEDVVARLIAHADNGTQPGSIGVRLQVVDGAIARAAQAPGPGVLIADVVEGGPAAKAGVRPGDLLVAINDDVDVSSPTQAMETLAGAPPDAAIRIRVVRGPATHQFNVVPVAAYEVASLARMTERADPDGLEAGRLFDEGQLGGAGLSATHRILAINGRVTSTLAAARRELRKRSPALLLVRDGDHQYFAAWEASQ